MILLNVLDSSSAGSEVKFNSDKAPRLCCKPSIALLSVSGWVFFVTADDERSKQREEHKG